MIQPYSTMKDQTLERRLRDIVKSDPRFAQPAYEFLSDALEYAMARYGKQEKRGHVSGEDLLHGYCEYALKQFGPMASTVIKEWGIHSGFNVGEMVYNMIDAGIFGQEGDDSLSDFRGVLDLISTLEAPYQMNEPVEEEPEPSPKKKTSGKKTKKDNHE